MQYPTNEAIEQLHRKYAPDDAAFQGVWKHSLIVLEIAQGLAEGTDADLKLVRVGCLLHDIGVYHVGEDNYIEHGVRGETILRDEGYDDVICRFPSHHTGSGITKEQVEERKLPLPAGDYLAETVEERLVMYADKFHTKPPRFVTVEQRKEDLKRHGKENVKRFEAMMNEFGVPDVEALSKKYGHPIVT